MRVGSLCSGYGGIELALAGIPELEPELAWVSEIDADASTVLEANWPDITNIGDLKGADPEPVDIITAGFPCQPLSQAGHRKGTEDDRWIWDDIQTLVGRMEPRPRLLLLENVPGLLSANSGEAMARVVQGLASLGYMGAWRALRAGDVGACHQRRRIFIVAEPADADGRRVGSDTRADRGDEPSRPRPTSSPLPPGPEVAHPEDAPPSDRSHQHLPTPAASDGSRGPDYARQRHRAATGSGGDDLTTAVAKMLPTPAASNAKDWTDSRATPDTIAKARGDGGSGTLVDIPNLLPTPTAWLGSADARSDLDSERRRLASAKDGLWKQRSQEVTSVAARDAWGDYAEAIARHETILGRPPPPPTIEGNRRLNPAFVEWMMMLPEGWVTNVDLPRKAQLKILGNGVVPTQAAYAYLDLLGHGT